MHFQTFPDTPAAWKDEARAENWKTIRRLRRVVTGALETERREKRIGSSLEAAPEVFVTDAAYRAALMAEMDSSLEAFLADISITSQASLTDGDGPAEAFRLEDVGDVSVVPGKAAGTKCARSWKYSTEVGQDSRYPSLTLRDADAVAAWDNANG